MSANDFLCVESTNDTLPRFHLMFVLKPRKPINLRRKMISLNLTSNNKAYVTTFCSLQNSLLIMWHFISFQAKINVNLVSEAMLEKLEFGIHSFAESVLTRQPFNNM